MASEDFKRFLVERLLDLDGSLSDAAGSVIYTKVVDPVLKRLGTDPLTVDIEAFVLARLRDEFPNLDVNSPGSVLRDVLVSPLVLILEPLQTEIAHLRRQKSLADADTLDAEEMDALLSNFLLVRSTGATASVIIRVFFNSPRVVNFDASITFSSSSGVAFIAASEQTFYPTDMKRAGNLYYLDISAKSLEPTAEANVAAGEIKFVNGLDGVVRVINNTAASGGVTSETNEGFLARAERAISERSLNTSRGIETNVRNSFSDILSIEVVGYGEPDMQRDILQGTVASTTTETAGALVYATSSFRTLAAIDPGNSVVVPFTNTIRLHSVPTTKVAAIRAAKYVRVVDGNGFFDGTLLSRLREIDSTDDVVAQVLPGRDVLIRLKDFTTYPEQPVITAAAPASNVLTNSHYTGLNRFSRRGSEWVLFANDSGTDKLTGALLPFTDYIDISALAGTPAAVIPGRDFLVSISADKWVNAAFTGAAELPTAVRTYPLDSFYTGGHVGISRIDSFLDSRSRVNYTGPATYTFQSSRPTSGAVDVVEVKAYGGPNTAATWTPGTVNTRYDGISKPTYGRNPGVSLRARDPGGADPLVFTAATIGTQAKEVDVMLNPAGADWPSMGVAVGDHIVCCIMHDLDVPGGGFTGAITSAQIPGKLAWQGWGKISVINPAAPHIVRVVGMDISALHTQGALVAINTYAGFSRAVALPGQFAASEAAAGAALLAPTPAPDGATAILVFQLPNAPGAGHPSTHPGIKPTTVSVLNNHTGNTYTDAGTGLFNAHAELVSGTVNYVTGVVTLTFVNPALHAPNIATFNVGFTYYQQDMYRAYWTVYVGEREMVTPDGVAVTSYEELAFAPAYKLHAGAAAVSRPMPAGYRTAPTAGGLDGFKDNVSTSNVAYDNGGGALNTHNGVWIRLNNSFYDTANSIAASPAKLSYSAELTSVYEYSGGALPTPKELYVAARVPDAVSKTMRDTVNAPLARTAVSLPYIEGALRISNVANMATLAVDTTTSVLENSKGHAGFLLPHPMGSMNTSAAVNAVQSLPATWLSDLTLTNQLVEVYSPATIESGGGGIVVSGIPGSTPFPGAFPGNLLVEDNKIHLGGLTDVYIKAASEVPGIAGPITCSPASLLDTAEVLVTGKDGSVVATNEFTSPLLTAYLATAFPAVGTKALDNLALVIINPAALTPVAARLLNNTAGGARVDGTYSDTIANLHWRLISLCSTNLVEPLVVIQQGTDLVTVAGSAQVSSASGFTFLEDPAAVAIYLRLDAVGEDFGDHLVLTRGGGVMTLSEPLSVSASSVSYKVCLKQSSSVQLPLVRVTDVTLAGANAGVLIPYKHPVDVVTSSFGGLNNDPITDTSAHGSGLGSLVVDGANNTQFTTAAPVNFPALGVLVNDVLRLEEQDGALRYFYVTGFDGNDTLVLDRKEPLVTSDITGLKFTLGHPSIGTADLRFLDPTFISVDKAAVFSAVIGENTYKFRPSPAESAPVYQSAVTVSGVTVANFGGLPKLLESTSTDFFKYGVAAGDKVQILTRVIKSQLLPASTGYAVAGKSLVISVAGVPTIVVFSGPNPRTLSEIAADINRVLQDKLLVTVEEVNPGVSWKLVLASRNVVEITNDGSTGLLTTLGFTVVGDRKNNTPTTMVATFTVDEVTHVAGTSTIKLTATTTASVGTEVFIKVLRAGEQRLYPADLAQSANGLWGGQIRLLSYDPLVDEVVPVGTSLTVTGHKSLGYDFTVENTNYTYSMGEQCAVRVTSVVLDATATDFGSVYVLPESKITVEYESAPTVADVQAYMLTPEVRVVNHNPLVRHFLPAYPLLSINYSGNQTADAVLAAVADFLQSRYPNKPLEVFDLMAVLARLNIQYVLHPQEIAAITHDSSRAIRVIRAQDILVLGKNYHLMGDTSTIVINRAG